MGETFVEIEPSRLRPGMYVHLDLGWMEHPFPWNRFKIRTEAEIRALCSLGLKTVRYCRERSDTEPLAATASDILGDDATAEVTEQLRAEMAAVLDDKRRRKEQLARYRAMIAEATKTLAASGKTLRGIHDDVFTRPQASLQSAGSMIDGFAGQLPASADTVLYSINDKIAGAAIYNHSVNVTILSILLARKLDFSADAIKQIGMGCLFHDIGMTQIPARVWNMTEVMTPAEKTLFEDHCTLGAKIVRDAGLSAAAIDIVLQHHELADGSGYPGKLTQAQSSPLARLVAIVEIYEHFCNSPDPALSLTPHEAMSQLFVRYRSKLDARMLEAFVSMMGVYPPGSIVTLSNDAFGIVLSVTSGRPLKPTLMIFDPEIPREDAVPLDMEAVPDIRIVRAIRPTLLPPEAFSYLSPRRRAIYYFGSAQ